MAIDQIHAYVPDISFSELVPFILLLGGAILCLLVDAATDKQGSRRLLPLIAGASILAAFVSFFLNFLPTLPFIEDTFLANEFGQLGCLVILFAALVQTMMMPRLVEKRNLPSGEVYALIMFATFGMVLLTLANELLTALISLEILSLSLYVLTGIDRRSRKATEASFKYIILGAFASAFLIFGIAFIYGATHTTFLTEVAAVAKAGGVTVAETMVREGGAGPAVGSVEPLNPIWIYMGFALIFVGACFKLSLAPFHMWAPDVYEGANTPTTMMIATGSKVAALAFLVALVQALSNWVPFTTSATFIIGLVVVASMLWGNLAALAQSNIKRMLAYSSVAHTGYASIGVLVLAALPATLTGYQLESAQAEVRQAIVFYMAAYTLMNVLAFGIAFYVGGEGHMGAYRGLVRRKPVAALGMAITMFSLLGIPPTVGFMGKFYVFKEAVQHGFVEIAIIGVLASVVSAFYYLGLVVTMFMREESEVEKGVSLAGMRAEPGGVLSAASASRITLVGTAVLVFLFGILPGLFFALDFNLGLF